MSIRNKPNRKTHAYKRQFKRFFAMFPLNSFYYNSPFSKLQAFILDFVLFLMSCQNKGV